MKTMMRNIRGKKTLSYIVMSIFLVLSVQTPALAAMMSTDQLVADNQIEMKRDELKSLFAKGEVRDKLVDMGVNPDDAQSRVDSLTGAEVLALHDNMEDLPAGEGALGTIALVLLILILLDITGVTDIFPGV